MTEILVVANRTLGGEKLLDLARSRAQSVQDVSFRLVVPQIKAHGGPRDLRRGGARIGADQGRSGVDPRGPGGHAGERRNRRSRPVPGDDGRDRTAPSRRDHRLHPPRDPVRMAATRSDRAHPQRLGPARRARRDRSRSRRAAVRGDARDRLQDLQRRGADRAAARQGGAGRAHATVHRRGPAAGRQRRCAARGARAARMPCSTSCTARDCSRRA